MQSALRWKGGESGVGLLRNSAFDFSGTSQDNASYIAQAGRWETRSVKGETDSGTYTFLNPDMVSIAGKLGAAIWTRVQKRSAGLGSRSCNGGRMAYDSSYRWKGVHIFV